MSESENLAPPPSPADLLAIEDPEYLKYALDKLHAQYDGLLGAGHRISDQAKLALVGLFGVGAFCAPALAGAGAWIWLAGFLFIGAVVLAFVILTPRKQTLFNPANYVDDDIAEATGTAVLARTATALAGSIENRRREVSGRGRLLSALMFAVTLAIACLLLLHAAFGR